MRDAAHGLAVHDRRVDRAADIVDGEVAQQRDEAGLGIDFELADMRGVGPGEGLVAMER